MIDFTLTNVLVFSIGAMYLWYNYQSRSNVTQSVKKPLTLTQKVKLIHDEKLNKQIKLLNLSLKEIKNHINMNLNETDIITAFGRSKYAVYYIISILPDQFSNLTCICLGKKLDIPKQMLALKEDNDRVPLLFRLLYPLLKETADKYGLILDIGSSRPNSTYMAFKYRFD